MKGKNTLFLVALVALGAFALPGVMATFAGSHTMEAPTAGGRSLDCTQCHQYIVTELNATNMSYKTLNAHMEAANDVGFTNYMFYGEPSTYNTTDTTVTLNSTSETGYLYVAKDTIVNGNGRYHPNGKLYIMNSTTSKTYSFTASWNDVEYTGLPGDGDYVEYYQTNITPVGAFTEEDNNSLDVNGDGSVDIKEVCKLCHWRGFFGVEGTHSGMTVVGCTNANCHGNSKVAGKAFDYNPTEEHFGAGWQLSRQQEAHSNFYYAMNSTNSTYVTSDNKTGNGKTNLSADYYTCLACHTHVGMKLNIKRPAAYDVVFNKSGATLADYQDQTGAWLESLEINHTATNMNDNGCGAPGNYVNCTGLNTSNITIIKDPTSVWIDNVPGVDDDGYPRVNKWR